MIKDNLEKIKNSIPGHVKLVAVSKTKPVNDILTAYKSGHKIFGENKVQELAEKQVQLPNDIEWHMIGHLQRNKVKYIASFVHLIHGVDSFRLLEEIDKQANKNNRVIDCLLQVHIAKEETKYGFSFDEIHTILGSDEFKALTNIKITGLMGMATFTDNNDLVREEFKTLKYLFKELKNKHFDKDDCFNELSMGMSGDYQIAIEEGSTIVRIGSLIFGARNY